MKRSLLIGLAFATTLAVGFVAYKTVPELTVAAALTLGAIVAPPDAVSATAIGRRLGLPRRVMTLLGGEAYVSNKQGLFDDDGNIGDETTQKFLQGFVDRFATLVEKLSGKSA